MLKKLTDNGHSISHVANHSLKMLRNLAAEIPDKPAAWGDGPAGRVSLVGPRCANLFQNCETLEIVVRHESMEKALAVESPHVSELLLLETETLFEKTLQQALEYAEACGIGKIVMLYRFGPREVIRQVAESQGRVMAIRGAADEKRLLRECLFQIESLGRQDLIAGPIPDRLFSSAQISRLEAISSSVDCECPRHLGELLKSLNAFESYSETCEDRNEQDALIHAHLYRATAHARRMIEESLQHLLVADGIDIGD